MNQSIYVTRDGSWGVFEGEDLKIVPANNWTEEDFNRLDEACDSDKYAVVIEVNNRIINELLMGIREMK